MGRILENLGTPRLNKYEDLSSDWLEKKVEYCRDHLAVQSHVSPGLSKYRAYISAHIAEPLYWLAKNRFLRNNCIDELHQTMAEVAEHLAIVIDIWGTFRKTSEEKLIADNANALLEVVGFKYMLKNTK